jgi:prolyl-tRNA synthetase
MGAAKQNDRGVSPARGEDFPAWFQSVVKEAEVAELDHAPGCMVIRPWGYAIWERMQAALDGAIKRTGAQNAYFPLFIPVSYFEREAEHVEGFAKEMAVVTHHRLEQDPEDTSKLRPAGELTEPLVIRPTSETIIGASFAKWINSYRDLPLMINQWANIVRWEMRPRVLLRTREFLWQEGHTAHASEEEAREETEKMLGVYREFAETMMAMPVIAGEKSENERFPGAVVTQTIEAMMQDGKALQAGTSHYLGQNFSRAEDIRFLGKNGEQEYAYTTSWGVSTRLIGALIMSHGDDTGLRLPPTLAPHQVVIVPIVRGDAAAVLESAEALAEELRGQVFGGEEVRAFVDTRDRKPPDKRWEWIRKGVPVVIELGPRDIENGVVSAFRRDAEEISAEATERAGFVSGLTAMLEEIQSAYLDASARRLAERTATDVRDLDAFRDWFSSDEDEDTKGFVRAPWSEDPATEAILDELKVSVRCIPFDQKLEPGAKCVISGEPAKVEAVFGKAY